MAPSNDLIESMDEPIDQPVPTKSEEDSSLSGRYLTGSRLWIGGIGLSLNILLPSLEVSIVSTSLITISNEFNGYNEISWIVTAYLVTYTGFLVIWSKLSHLLGLKPTLLVSMLLFLGFSAGCGASQSMKQLIIFRSLQGIGGSGVYSVTTIGFIQMVPPSRYAQITAIASCIMSLGMILGPLLGGAINEKGQWRWIFYLNLPVGVVGLAMCFFAFPNGFPHHCDPKIKESNTPWLLKFVKKPDTLGAFLLLGASVLFVGALEEGGSRYPWNSAIIISLFAVSGVMWVGFFSWEWIASREGSEVEPMFPTRFFRNRIWMGVLVGCFLSGAPLTIAVIELPQRYQVVNASSPLQAGVKLLAYAVACPVAIVVANTSAGKFKIPFIYVIIAGCVLQTVGFSLMSTLPTYVASWNGQYGYSVIAGFGTGLTLGALYMVTPVAVDAQDQALAIGSALQFRMLGGAVGIAVVNAALNEYIKSHLPLIIHGVELEAVLSSTRSILLLPTGLQKDVRAVYGEGYNLQMRVTIGFCGACFLATALMWKKTQLRVGKDGIPGQ